MSIEKDNISEYLNNTKFIVLATVNKEQAPVLRSLGAFGVDELITYFSTNKGTDKVEQIESNPKVSILFQQENQELPSFVNVTITGKAIKITEEEELDKAISVIGGRNKRFKERVEKGEIKDNIIYRVDPLQVKILDFSKGAGPNAVQVIYINRKEDYNGREKS